MDDLVDQLIDRLIGKVAGLPQQVPSLIGKPSLANMYSRGASMHPSAPQSATFTSPKGAVPKFGLGSGLVRRSFAARHHGKDEEHQFHYGPVDVDYDELSVPEVANLMNQGWTLLDVRSPDQTARAAVKGSVEVPLFIQKHSSVNDLSPLGLYQEALNFGLGGWWMGSRPMKENHDFVRQVEQVVGKDSPGVILACQSGLRSKQAMKELHVAGYPRMVMLKGGFNKVKPGDLPCVSDEYCDLSLANSGSIAGMLRWRSA